MHLLDINFLLARIDKSHPKHELVKFRMGSLTTWATCPITENGFLRILGNPNYPGYGPGTPEGASIGLRGLILGSPTHQFLPDDISILDSLVTLEGVSASQLTDNYLLALAVRNQAKFLTLDTRIDPSKVSGGNNAYELVE